MSALEDNPDTRIWKKLGDSISPRAILRVSAHFCNRYGETQDYTRFLWLPQSPPRI